MSKYTDKRNEEFESYRNPHEDERYDGYDNNETCNNKSRRGIRLLIIVLVGVMLIAVWESTSSDQTYTEEVPEVIAQKGSNIGIRQYHAANSEQSCDICLDGVGEIRRKSVELVGYTQLKNNKGRLVLKNNRKSRITHLFVSVYYFDKQGNKVSFKQIKSPIEIPARGEVYMDIKEPYIAPEYQGNFDVALRLRSYMID